MSYALSHFSFSYKTRSFLLFFLLFLVDSILREFVGEQVHKYVLSLYILGFFFYYRFGLGQGNALLNAALVFQFVGIFLATYVTKNVWFFSIMMIVLNLNIVLFSFMLYKCAKIKKVSLYLIGFLLTLPYGIVMNFKISDYYGALFWGGSVENGCFGSFGIGFCSPAYQIPFSERKFGLDRSRFDFYQ